MPNEQEIFYSNSCWILTVSDKKVKETAPKQDRVHVSTWTPQFGQNSVLVGNACHLTLRETIFIL